MNLLNIKKLLSFTFLILLISNAFSQQMNSPTYGYYVDLPVGFTLSDKTEDGKSYIFENKSFDVRLCIKLYDKNAFSSAAEALSETLNLFRADGNVEEFIWNHTESSVAVFEMLLNGIKCSGYGISSVLPDDKGIIVMFDWTDSRKSDSLNDFLVSALDSLSIDRKSLYGCGLMTSFLYPEAAEKCPVKLQIDGKTISTLICSNDVEAADYVVAREYNVLLLYERSKKWKEAWTRYYRMIYKDSFERMKRPAFDIYNVLAENAADDTDLAQKLLTWTQNLSYDRAKSKNESDFTSLPAVLLGNSCDCDSRSMMLSVLLTHMNMDSIFFISAEYSHAMAGLTSTHPGKSFTVNSKKYLTGETAAKGITWGKLAQTMADESKWIPVVYP